MLTRSLLPGFRSMISTIGAVIPILYSYWNHCLSPRLPFPLTRRCLSFAAGRGLASIPADGARRRCSSRKCGIHKRYEVSKIEALNDNSALLAGLRRPEDFLRLESIGAVGVYNNGIHCTLN